MAIIRTDMPDDAPPVFVGANAVLLFDGIFLGRKELDPYWDLRILVGVDSETSIARAVRRDAGASDPRELEKKYRLRYEPSMADLLRKGPPRIESSFDCAQPRRRQPDRVTPLRTKGRARAPACVARSA